MTKLLKYHQLPLLFSQVLTAKALYYSSSKMQTSTSNQQSTQYRHYFLFLQFISEWKSSRQTKSLRRHGREVAGWKPRWVDASPSTVPQSWQLLWHVDFQFPEFPASMLGVEVQQLKAANLRNTALAHAIPRWGWHVRACQGECYFATLAVARNRTSPGCLAFSSRCGILDWGLLPQPGRFQLLHDYKSYIRECL